MLWAGLNSIIKLLPKALTMVYCLLVMTSSLRDGKKVLYRAVYHLFEIY